MYIWWASFSFVVLKGDILQDKLLHFAALWHQWKVEISTQAFSYSWYG